MPEIILIDELEKLDGQFHYESPSRLNYRYQDVNYSAEIKETEDARVLEVIIKGKSHFVKVENALDRLIAKMGLNVLDAKDAGDIFSPMPGLVLEVLVKPGDTVEADQPVVILEAMKMENIIKTEGAGVIESVNISKGGKVEKGQLLISIKPQE